ncbi:nitroreductase family deazaflavin-dependent oxidoreductase [Nocardia sp. NRRL WC-3656]|uniref:nitroreductase family deazaflavin-dependent oxidoreductase n=1 Tax=Nocardia sp. NRRL WC-3656 TaxID=1463824 RepID=UPI0018CC5B36|nr:nitroreductase family deazaflavin-dependent oxidoreductase [Nocardia sp. NRRL WC-3656]
MTSQWPEAAVGICPVYELIAVVPERGRDADPCPLWAFAHRVWANAHRGWNWLARAGPVHVEGTSVMLSHTRSTSTRRRRLRPGGAALGGLGAVLVIAHLAIAVVGTAALWDWLGGLLAGLVLLVLVAAHLIGGARLGHGVIGRVIAWLLRIGVLLGPVMLLTVAGRRTGLPRTNPVDVFEHGDQRWLVATHTGDAQWVRNLRAAGRGSLVAGHRRLDFTAVELPTDQAAAVLNDVVGLRIARRLGGVVLRRTLGVGRHAGPNDFARIAAEHPVFELNPVVPPSFCDSETISAENEG